MTDVLVKRFSQESTSEPVVRKWCEFFREAEVLNRLQHPNIIKLLGVSRSEPSYVVCQLTGKTFLSSFLRDDKGKKIKLKETVHIATQVSQNDTIYLSIHVYLSTIIHIREINMYIIRVLECQNVSVESIYSSMAIIVV